MPIYEYICKNCGHEFEELQTMKEGLLKTCPVCGKETLARLIGSGSGVIFKGSGFYHTDYKHSSSTGKHKKETEEKKESKTKADEKPTAAEPSHKKTDKKESKKK